jgi:hypothetical protein
VDAQESSPDKLAESDTNHADTSADTSAPASSRRQRKSLSLRLLGLLSAPTLALLKTFGMNLLTALVARNAGAAAGAQQAAAEQAMGKQATPDAASYAGSASGAQQPAPPDVVSSAGLGL